VSKAALFDVEPVERWQGRRELVAISLHACPSCGCPIGTQTVETPALLRHGGYGATRRVVMLYCWFYGPARCNWRMVKEITEVRP